jgi:hypothetical protein
MAAILKFKCERCGQRIAVQPKHLNKLITCPECGQSTHPLAEQIVSAREQVGAGTRGRGGKSGSSKRSPEPADKPEAACANCGDGIGRLQKQHLWEGKPVCKPCHRKLSNEATKAGAPAVRDESTPARKPRASRWRSKQTAAKVKDRAQPQPAIAPEKTELAVATREGATGSPLAATLITRALTGAGGGGENLRVIPMTFGTAWVTLRGRLLAVLLVVCILAAAVYGAMSLLRDIAGIIASIAFVMLAAVAMWLLLRAGLQAGRRFVAARMKNAASHASGGASPVTVDVTEALTQPK